MNKGMGGAMGGTIWFIGWLFTWSFASLVWWKILFALSLGPTFSEKPSGSCSKRL